MLFTIQQEAYNKAFKRLNLFNSLIKKFIQHSISFSPLRSKQKNNYYSKPQSMVEAFKMCINSNTTILIKAHFKEHKYSVQSNIPSTIPMIVDQYFQ